MADLIPVIRANMGGRDYYIGKMTFQELSAKVQFFRDVQSSNRLDDMLQRALGGRTTEMKEYLLNQSERFYGAIIVASWGGRPQYIKVKMEDHPLLDDDFDFGLLKFDGRQSYFALDGQHRLQSIKDAIDEDSSLRNEEVSVVFVTHELTEEGNVKTRRLFHTLNRHAKKTTHGENITLDEDNVISIATRMLLRSGIKLLEQDHIELVNRGLRKNSTSFTSLAAIHDLNKAALEAVYTFPRDYLRYRPSDVDVENTYDAIAALWNTLHEEIPELNQFESGEQSAIDFREPNGDPSKGHLLFRPIGLGIYGSLIAQALSDEDDLPQSTGSEVDPAIWKRAVERILPLGLRLGERPWRGTVFRSGSMDTTKAARGLAVRLACYMLNIGHVNEEQLLEDYQGHLDDLDAVLPDKVVEG